ncbi:MAG: hypothetical protein MZV70_40905 [Desulfobacterales bacterium]|nr:hypothetical protein [Desulfobacterales bacterium]
MIAQEVARKGLQQDIKLGPGGIREIEFFGQMFQLIRGGREPRAAEARRSARSSRRWPPRGYIPEAVRRELDAAYVFLRTVEHRLQEAADQQTHELPSDPSGLARLAAAMGFDDPAPFRAALDRHRDARPRPLSDAARKPRRRRAATGDLDNGLGAIWQQRIGRRRGGRQSWRRSATTRPAEALQILDELRERLRNPRPEPDRPPAPRPADPAGAGAKPAAPASRSPPCAAWRT